LLNKELVDRVGLSQSDAKWVALRSQGRIGKALSLAKEDKDGVEDDISTSLPELFQRNKASLLHIFRNVEDLAKAQDPLDILLSWYRDLLLIKQGCSEALLIHGDQKDELEKMARLYSDIQIEKFIKSTMQTRSLMQRNINQTLALEVLMLKSADTLSTRL
jgi:DNA polymerase-3 subunit delta'